MSQKRELLIKTGESLFIKHGMRRVTVEEICRQANVSKPTFYKYFKNKEDLARKIDQIWINEALQKIQEIETAEIAFSEKMKRILAVKIELSSRPGPEFLEDLISLNINLDHVFERAMLFLRNSQKEGELRADIPPEFLLAAFTVLNNMQFNPAIRGLYNDAEKLAEDVFKFFYYGALSSKNREIELSEE